MLARWFSEWHRAELLLQQAVSIRQDPVSLFFMADFLETQNRFDEAEAFYQKCLRRLPSYIVAWKRYVEFVMWRKRNPCVLYTTLYMLHSCENVSRAFS